MNGSCSGFSVPSSANTQNLSFAKFPQAARIQRPPLPTRQAPTGWVFSGAPLHRLVRKVPLMVYGNGITNR